MSGLPPGARRFSLAALPAQPWRNGGGITFVVGSDGTDGADDWSWRVSLARIDRDGDFSAFTGVDRQLSLVSGDGLALQGGGRTWPLVRPGDTIAFPGELPVTARLAGLGVRVWNVMVRRPRAPAIVRWIQPGRTALERPDTGAACWLLLAVGAEVSLDAGEGSFPLRLAPDEGLLVAAPMPQPGAGPYRLRVHGAGGALLTSIGGSD